MIKIEQDKLIYELDENEKTASIVDNNSASGDLFIPLFIKHNTDEYLITKISEDAFKHLMTITSVRFPENSQLQVISKNAFRYSSIESIYIPPHVTRICEYAFYSCQKLKHVEIPENSELKMIEKYAFADSSLEKIFIPKHVTQISEYSFSTPNKLQQVQIPYDSELETIENCAFLNSLIEELFFPPKLIHLKNGWCRGTSNLISVKVMAKNPKFMTLNYSAIIGKSDTKSDIYDTLMFVNRSATKVNLPSFIKKIGSYAFSESHIESIEITEHITKICEGAFSDCRRLCNVTFSENSHLGIIEKFAFSNTTISSIKIPKKIKILTEGIFLDCVKLKDLSFEEPSELSVIEKEAFSDTIIENLSIPSTICELENDWCCGTSNLYSAKIDGDNEYFINYQDDKMILGKSDQNSSQFDVIKFVQRNVSQIEIPPYIKKIDSYAFSSSNIISIFLPPSVERICKYCFAFCEELTMFQFHPDSKIQEIEQYAFHYSALYSFVVIPQITSIAENAFSNCMFLYDLLIPRDSNLQVIEDDAFNNSAIYSIFIPQNIRSISNTAFCDCDNLIIVEFDENADVNSVGFDYLYDIDDLIVMLPVELSEYVD